jgi:glycosyltransferase involved in cell wall biosynthesis
MPRFVLETLAVGRPVVATHLPQLESVIRDGESGFLVPRTNSRDGMADQLVQRFIDIERKIEMGVIDPARVATSIRTFTPDTQLARVFRYHQEIQNARGIVKAIPSY